MPQTISNPANLFSHLTGDRLNVNRMRPFVNSDGKTYFVNNGQMELHTNDGLLMYDEWKDLDRTVIDIATDRLVGVADLQAGGLTHNLGSIGVTITQWEESSDMDTANISMSGVTRGDEDTPAFKQAQVPVPVVHKDFRLNIRRLEASRRFGQALDVTSSSIAARKVAESSEDMLFAGNPITVDGNTIYGYTNHPDRNTETLGTAWDALAKTAYATIKDQVLSMVQKAEDDGYYGPFNLYIPTEYSTIMSDDYDPDSADNRTVRDRLLQIDQLNSIKVADRLTADNVVLVQMTRDVVDLAVAQDVTTVQWDDRGGMSELFKVMAVWVPRIKKDYDGNSGIVHLS